MSSAPGTSPSGDHAEFGRAILNAHFPHIAATGVTMLNSGSFGIAPKSVLDKKFRIVQDFESYGDRFVRQRLLGSFSDNVAAVAKLLNLRPEQCTLVDNVTTGISNLLDCLANRGDTVLVNSWTYGAVKSAAEMVGEFAHRQQPDSLEPQRHTVVSVKVQLPLASPEDIIDGVRCALDEHPEIKIAIFDHITSSTACVMPVAQLAELCHSRGVLVIIDGAHALGQLPGLDIAAVGADFYVGNLHKWMFAAKSAALLWSSEAMASGLRPSVVSWLVRESQLATRYAFLGTRDASSLGSVAEAVRFVTDVCGGLDRIHAYCSQLADEASRHLAQAWHSEKLAIPSSMEAPFMRLVALPEHLQLPEIREMTSETRLMSPMWDFLLNRLKMDLLLMNIEDRLYIRVSFAVFVCMDDIRRLADVMMKLTRKNFIG